MDIPDSVPQKTMGERAELMIMLPPEWNISPDNLNSEQGYWPIAWLTMLADFARTPGNWLGTGYVFPNGDPMTEIADTPFSGVLVLPPFVSHPHEYYAFHSRDGTRLSRSTPAKSTSKANRGWTSCSNTSTKPASTVKSLIFTARTAAVKYPARRQSALRRTFLCRAA